MQSMNYGADGGLTALIPLLWVIVLMAAVVVSSIAQRREEITRMRVGIELEVLRNDHAENAPNHAIATWLDSMRSRYGERYIDQYFATLKKRRSEYLRTRKHRRAEIRKGLPQEYRGRYYRIQNEGWSSGNTTNYTKVTTDGSLSSGGFEVVSHPLVDGEHHGWLATIGKLLRHITKIDRTCGLHVHIGLRDPHTQFGADGQMSTHDAMSIAGRCAWAYAYFTGVFNQFVSASRHNGGYCQDAMQLRHEFGSATQHTVRSGRRHVLTPDEEGEGIEYRALDPEDPTQGYWKYTTVALTGDALYHKFYEYMVDMGRYYHCNLGSLLRRGFGTIEYRQHQGTSNPVKVSNWIQLMYEFTTACASKSNFEAIEAYPQTQMGLWAFLDLAPDDPLVDYYRKRASVLRGEPLIRPCPSCGSNTCVHYECEGGNDPLIRSALSEIPSRNSGWYCGGCDDPVTDVDFDDHTCYCESCEEHHDAYQFSGWATLGLSLLFMAPAVGAVALIVGCGIGAIHAGTKKFRAKNNLKRLFASLASRGGQASGYAWDGKKEEHVWHLKAPTSSKYLKERIDKHISKSTTWAMLHTRFATHGKNNADNAHPHFGPEAHVTLVHNGVVHNHDDVWKDLGLKPTGPVDSQAVAAALEVGGIEKVVELCEGSMSLIWSDTRDPKGTLKFWSNGGNPLCAGRLDHPNRGHLVVASTLDILEKSQGSRLKTSWSCTVGREYTVAPDGSITHRDIEGSEETAGYTYDWRTYNTLFGNGKSKSSKKRTIKVKQPKAGGDADNCAIVFTGKTKNYNFDDEDLNEALNEAWAFGSISGWAVWHSPTTGRGFDGYDGVHHQGIRAEDGTKYHLPSYVDGQAMDPQFNTEFQVQVLKGEFDPRPRVEDYDDTAEWIDDPLTALGWYNDEDPRDYLHW